MAYLPFVTAALGVVIALVLYFTLKRREHFSKFEKLGIRGPKPSLIFGNCLEIWQKTHTVCQKEWLDQYGPVVGYFFGYQPTLLIADKNILKSVLLKDFQNFADRGDLLGRDSQGFEGLTNLQGQRWKEVRSTLTPSFTSSKLKQLSPEVAVVVDDFMQNVDKSHKSGQEFEIYELYQGLTLDIICRSAMGVKFAIQEDLANSELLRQVKYIFSGAEHMETFISCFPLVWKVITPLTRFLMRIISRGEHPTLKMIKQCEEIIKHRQSNPDSRRLDLLQLLVDAQAGPAIITKVESLIAGDEAEKHEADQLKGLKTSECPMQKAKSLTDKEVLNNAFLVLLAGYETTSTSLAFITRMLIRFPEVQQQLREELLQATDDGTVFDFERLQKCQFLESVIQEVLRMYPPIHSFTSRRANEEKIYGDLKIPRGLDVLIPMKYLHFDEEVFEKAQEFRPARFLPENKTPAMSWSWQPFGAGPRNCIGMRFAQMSIKITLAKLLTKYRLTASNEPLGEAEIKVQEKSVLQRIKDPLLVKTELV